MSFLSYLYLLYENEQGRKRAQAPNKYSMCPLVSDPIPDQKKQMIILNT